MYMYIKISVLKCFIFFLYNIVDYIYKYRFFFFIMLFYDDDMYLCWINIVIIFILDLWMYKLLNVKL